VAPPWSRPRALGAHVVGSDVDPLAVRIVSAELRLPQEESLRTAGAELLTWLTDTCARFYPAKDAAAPFYTTSMSL
jgi:hypothetical protein